MGVINKVVLGSVSFLLLAIIGPIAIGTIANATTVGWNTSVVTIFQVLMPIIWVIGMAIAFVPRGKGK